MNSDDYFDAESQQINSAFLAEVDALEAGYLTREKPPVSTHTHTPPSAPHDSDTNYDKFFDDLRPEDYQVLDNPSSLVKVVGTSYVPILRQQTLFGDFLDSPESSNLVKFTAPGLASRKVKQWDYHLPINSKSRAKTKAKGKAKASEEEEDDEAEYSPNLDLLYDPTRPQPPFKHKHDLLLAKHWVYPINVPKRSYQFNIAQNSLFDNSLVSLPTGLGKTFIAGVIMLNYYRWFPEGKVVFLAPTKPLVAQQIDACHKICGIPGSHSIELTGQTVRSNRADFWREKRVFFMTPQTFMNDLKFEICNPTDIVLLVIDEAHRGTGDHSYAQIVRYLMIKNGHFRVLALTATPGSNTEAVQRIIDALHISRIEIRDENSFDLRQYILPKKITTHIIKMSKDIIRVRDLLAKAMNDVARRIGKHGLLPNLDVMKLHPYRCTAAQNDCKRAKFPPYIFGILGQLRSLAYAMGYLIECSLNMCYDHLQSVLKDSQQKVKKNKLTGDPLFQDVIKELERQRSKGFSMHPKIEKLTLLALEYFTKCDDEQEVNGESNKNRSKMMIFANYRMVVDEIVDALNQHRPIIRATRFVGQGADKQGNKGIVQREQLEIIQKFKGDEINVLVATSIGEEGLDIGEVDCIICYDAQKTPIRMLQRIGRTGRRRAGRVEVLLSENREETNWEKARNDYESVQKAILRGDSLQLYADVERLLPDYLKPVCQETMMPIEEYSREISQRRKNSSSLKGKKRKAGIAPNYHDIPPGAIDSFVPSSELLGQTSKKRRKLTFLAEKDSQKNKSTGSLQLGHENADDSYSDDMDLELDLSQLLKPKNRASSKPPSIVSIISSNSDVAEKLCSSKETEDHAWLLDLDLVDDRAHVSNEEASQLLIPEPSSSSSQFIRAASSNRRQRRRVSTESLSSQPPKAHSITLNPSKSHFLDLEAEVSGECSSDHSVSEIERDSDLRFLMELSPSQKLTSYNQTTAYLQSLLTQAHPNSQVPRFSSRIVRRAPFGQAHPQPSNVNRLSSPNRSTDRYSFDSFLVEDDDGVLST